MRNAWAADGSLAGRHRILVWAEPGLEAVRKRWTGRGPTPLRQAVQYFENGFPYWLTFLHHEGVEPTSNRAERGVRESVVFRKIVGTLRNQKGTMVYERLATCLMTWQQRGWDVNERLLAALG